MEQSSVLKVSEQLLLLDHRLLDQQYPTLSISGCHTQLNDGFYGRGLPIYRSVVGVFPVNKVIPFIIYIYICINAIPRDRAFSQMSKRLPLA